MFTKYLSVGVRGSWGGSLLSPKVLQCPFLIQPTRSQANRSPADQVRNQKTSRCLAQARLLAARRPASCRPSGEGKDSRGGAATERPSASCAGGATRRLDSSAEGCRVNGEPPRLPRSHKNAPKMKGQEKLISAQRGTRERRAGQRVLTGTWAMRAPVHGHRLSFKRSPQPRWNSGTPSTGPEAAARRYLKHEGVL